ncbi:MAG TPA: hypothetical protein VJ043_01690 [Candidatus Paceibacterota bacterium]|nr:hypothetical protein [Candidatus Paceibacterota bacterium]
MARKICYSCKQVIPSTPEERRLANEKRKSVEGEYREAWKAWESFYTPPDDTFLGVLSKLGLILFGYFGTGFGMTYLYTSPFYGDDGDLIQKFFSAIGVSLLVAGSFVYFWFVKPIMARELEEKKAKKEFVAKHKEFADMLWSEDKEN